MNKLDVTIGLGRMLGNKRLDLTMRCKDVEGQSGFTLLMKNAVAAGDMATGQRAAHSLKGVSGTIGATDIPTSPMPWKLPCALQNRVKPLTKR